MRPQDRLVFTGKWTDGRIKCTKCHPLVVASPIPQSKWQSKFKNRKSKMTVRTGTDGVRTGSLKNHLSKTPIIRTFVQKIVQKTSCLPGGGRVRAQAHPLFTERWTGGRVKRNMFHPP